MIEARLNRSIESEEGEAPIIFLSLLLLRRSSMGSCANAVKFSCEFSTSNFFAKIVKEVRSVLPRANAILSYSQSEIRVIIGSTSVTSTLLTIIWAKLGLVRSLASRNKVNVKHSSSH